MRKKDLPELIVRAVMCLSHGAKTKVRVKFFRSELSEEFSVQVGVRQESVLSWLLFAIMIDIGSIGCVIWLVLRGSWWRCLSLTLTPILALTLTITLILALTLILTLALTLGLMILIFCGKANLRSKDANSSFKDTNFM